MKEKTDDAESGRKPVIEVCVFVLHRVCVMSRQVNGHCKFPPLGDAVVRLKDTSKTPTPQKCK